MSGPRAPIRQEVYPRRFNRRREGGFALLAVIILIAVVSAAVAITLDEAVGSIQSSSRVRTAEMLKAGLDHGLSEALDQLATEDPIDIIERANDPNQANKWDMFDENAPGAGYLQLPPYPTTGPFTGQYQVRVGLKPGQIARPPTGEDVRSANGQVVEVQISVEAVGNGLPPAEERVSVGVLVPRRSSYSN